MRYSTYSVDDLIDQIAKEPTVARRYASHFGVPKDKIVDYFKHNLKLVTLRTPAKVTTYFVSKKGQILSKQRMLPAGRRVFVDTEGKILLQTDCGNPVTNKLPVVKTMVKAATETVAAPPIPEVVAPPPVFAGVPIADSLPSEALIQLPVAEPIFAAAPSMAQFVAVATPVIAGLNYVQASQEQQTETGHYVPEMGSVSLAAMGLIGIPIWRGRRSVRASGARA